MARSVSASERDVLRATRAAAGKRSPLDFVGCMTAVVAILPVSCEAAQAMLPAGLELAAHGVLPGDGHPLVLIMGKQSDVRPRAAPFGAGYLEFILAVPFVGYQGRGPHGPFCYCPLLFLDRRLPTIAGRLLYGYAKRLASIRMTESSYRIADLAQGEPLLSAKFRTTGGAGGPSRSGAAALFDLPVISQAAGGWWYSCADFGLDRAVVRPVELDLMIHQPFVSGLPVGDFLVADVEADGARAFRVRTSWRLEGPWARRSPPDCAGLDKGGQKR
jgi:Acetoacetate decarboxylase (ADC)